MYRYPAPAGLPPLMVANQQLKAGDISTAKHTLAAAGYSWADLTEARRSGSLGGTVVAPAAPEPFRLALDEGSVYISGNRVAIVPALLTAMAVKLVLFSGKQAARGVRRVVRRRPAAA
jgi:hypothetical protein